MKNNQKINRAIVIGIILLMSPIYSMLETQNTFEPNLTAVLKKIFLDPSFNLSVSGRVEAGIPYSSVVPATLIAGGCLGMYLFARGTEKIINGEYSNNLTLLQGEPLILQNRRTGVKTACAGLLLAAGSMVTGMLLETIE